jgi:catalase
MATEKRFTNATGSPVADNTNILTAGPRGPALLQDIWLIEINGIRLSARAMVRRLFRGRTRPILG